MPASTSQGARSRSAAAASADASAHNAEQTAVQQQTAPPAPTSPLKRLSLAARLAEVARHFGPFGFTAFGGPAANIVQLRRIFVVKLGWVDEQTFVDLFALGNALPGPAFSQLAFAISLLRGGILPALLSFVLLTGPGAGAMLGIGFAVKSLPAQLPPIVYALFSGLNSAAVGLIAHSAYTLSNKVVTDPLTRLIVLLSGSIASCYESQWLYPVLMVAGGLATFGWDGTKSRRERGVGRWEEVKRKRRGGRGQEEQVESEGAADIELEGGPSGASASARSGEAAHSSSATWQASTESVPHDVNDDKKDAPLASGSQEGVPSLVSSPARLDPPRPAAVAQEPAQIDEEEELAPSLYFKLGVQGGLALCAAFIAFFIAIVVARSVVDRPTRALDFFTNILLSGTLIFGGGPVVIPLLRGYTVDPGWVLPRDFLIGLALIQALPGPMFNFAIFLGVLALPSQPLVGALLALVAIFLPGLVLKVGTMPFYLRWRTSKITRSVLRGLNAAAVGLIYCAIYRLFRVGVLSPADVDTSLDPTATPAVYRSLDSDGFWVSIVGATFVFVEWFNVPAPGAIAGGLVGGLAWYGVTSA